MGDKGFVSLKSKSWLRECCRGSKKFSNIPVSPVSGGRGAPVVFGEEPRRVCTAAAASGSLGLALMPRGEVLVKAA